MDEIPQLLDKINKQVAILAHQIDILAHHVDILQIHNSISLLNISVLNSSMKASSLTNSNSFKTLSINTSPIPPPTSIAAAPSTHRQSLFSHCSVTPLPSPTPPPVAVATLDLPLSNPIAAAGAPTSLSTAVVGSKPLASPLPKHPTTPSSFIAAAPPAHLPSLSTMASLIPVKQYESMKFTIKSGSPMSDQIQPVTYSFGVVLFQVLCEKPALNPNLPTKEQEWPHGLTSNYEHKLFELMLEGNGQKFGTSFFVFDPGGTFILKSVYDLEDKVIFEGSVMIRLHMQQYANARPRRTTRLPSRYKG